MNGRAEDARDDLSAMNEPNPASAEHLDACSFPGQDWRKCR